MAQDHVRVSVGMVSLSESIPLPNTVVTGGDTFVTFVTSVDVGEISLCTYREVLDNPPTGYTCPFVKIFFFTLPFLPLQ